VLRSLAQYGGSSPNGAEAGIAATEDGSLARQRLTQMHDFYTFLFEETGLARTLAPTIGAAQRSAPKGGAHAYRESS